MGILLKFGEKLLLQNNVAFSLISWHSNLASYARGWGFFFRFLVAGGGGVVAGQIDTCMKGFHINKFSTVWDICTEDEFQSLQLVEL